ncbi:MAG: alpha/beta hydrolase [Pseudomonadota bacterium]
MSLLALVAMVAAAPPLFVEKPCSDPAIAAVARCGTVEVPENRARPMGRRIALNLVILKPASGKADLPPVFDIDGGPGLAVTKNAGFYATDGIAYRARREIVMIDQRGTGGSNRLSCPELEAPEGAYRPMMPVDAVKRCRDSLRSKADLRHYLTADAVADLEAVRIALGYGKIDLAGLSYGTTVALRYMATYPDQVRAALLMGVSPPTAMPPALHAPAAEGAFGLLAAQCKAEAACGKAFDPVRDFDAAKAGLKAKGELPPEVFAEKIRSMMYQPATARKIPWILSRAAAGDLTPFTEATKPSGPSPFADGMFLSVTCSEALALMDYDSAARAARRTRFGDYRLVRQRAACAAWPVGDAGKFLGPIKTSAAVLMVSGQLDPVTPPAWADILVQSLPRARHLVIPASGHVFDGLSGIDTCLDPLLVKFLETGDPTAVDPACLATMQPPAFATAR